ncbi:MAG TPA: hypothetical protein ENF75_04240 [Acidilobales archaeon]|nr:hypothetical protein [Acidilobales archaeon]
MSKGIYVINTDKLSNLKEKLEELRKYSLRNKLKSITIVLVTKENESKWVPEVRDLILNNLVLGIRVYALSPNDESKLLRLISEEASKGYIIKEYIGFDRPCNLVRRLEELGFKER